MAAVNDLSGQIRIGMNGFSGMDIPACLELLEVRGLDRRVAGLLLPFWERGTMAGIAEQREEQSE